MSKPDEEVRHRVSIPVACEDCLYFFKHPHGHWYAPREEYLCTASAFIVREHMDSCERARLTQEMCGIDGRWFRRRDQTKGDKSE